MCIHGVGWDHNHAGYTQNGEIDRLMDTQKRRYIGLFPFTNPAYLAHRLLWSNVYVWLLKRRNSKDALAFLRYEAFKFTFKGL